MKYNLSEMQEKINDRFQQAIEKLKTEIKDGKFNS